MDNFAHTKQPHHHYKSPRLKKQTSNEANSKNNENLRKSLALPLEGESPAKKGVPYFTKTTSDFVTGQTGTYGPLSKAMTPKVLSNMINHVGLQDSSKKGNKGPHVDRTKEGGSLPHIFDDDKIHGEELKMTKGLELYNGDIENQRQSYGQVSRLPAIHTKKVPSRTEAKKKYTRRVGLERQTNPIGLAKVEFEVVSNPLNASNRATQSNSSPTKQLGGVFKSQIKYENEEKEDINTSLGALCVDERGKNKGLEPLTTGGPINVIRKRYASGCARTLQSNLSGGEEEETPKENLSFSLLIAPVKGAQRTVKQIKKKTEVLKRSPSERKDKSVDLADLKQVRDKIVEKVKGKLRKPRGEDKVQDEMLLAMKKQKAVAEDKEEKKEEDDMEAWDKDESKEMNEGDDNEEEKEDAAVGEFEKKMTEREQEEKLAEDHDMKAREDANKNKPKERTPQNATIKKIGVTSPVTKEIPPETKEGISKSLVAAVVARANRRLQSHLHASKMLEKEKDLLHLKREQAYKEFMLRLNFSFNVKVRVPTEKTFTAYKYYLGKGNNSIMLKSMLKQRWWWVQIDNKDAADINFQWTQLKQNKFIDNLKQKRKTPFEGLEGSAMSTYSSNNDTTANSLTSIDSGTDNESDTAENEVASAGKPTKRTKGRKNTKKAKRKEEGEPKSHEDIHTAGLKKLFTNTEIMLMNILADSKGNMPLNSEEYEEIMKLKKTPVPQVIVNPSGMKMCNHLENNFHLANKKALLWNMRSYYEAIKGNVFDHLPLTFHVRNGFEDKEYQKFLEYYNNREKEIEEQEKAIQESKDAKKTIKKLRNIWIVKPGENTNRGIGIHVCNDLSQINELVAMTEGNTNGRKRTYLIQQYLDRPFLYNKRKFDIRCYILISCINGTMKGYWYQEGYIRTASKEFSLKNVTNKLVHLTNDAVQKKAEDYGKFEAGNKLSYGDFQKYLDQHYDGTINFNNDIYPKIRQLAIDSIKSVYGKIDPYRRENCFEIFGLDFMIDTDLRAWLIEVNTNPDINASSPALTRVIPNMVENALRLTLDQMYPPPVWQASKKQMLPENLLENNKFELVFDEVEDGPALRSILQTDKGATSDLILEIVAEEEEEDAEEECKD